MGEVAVPVSCGYAWGMPCAWLVLLAACGNLSSRPLGVGNPAALRPIQLGGDEPTEPVDTGEPWVCPDDDVPGDNGPWEVSGRTIGAFDDGSASCGGAVSEDLHLAFTAPATGTYLLQLTGNYDTVLAVFDDCDGAELACASDEIQVDLSAGEEVVVLVDGDGGEAGSFELLITEGLDEVCGSGFDDDGDGAPDCLDPDCASDATCTSPCADGVLLTSFSGNTTGASDDWLPSCTTLSTAPDLASEFVAPATGTYVFDTVGSAIDTVLTVLADCGGVELGCDDDTSGLQSEVTVDLAAGQRVLVVVDGYNNANGNISLTVR